jgi:hypothetical protein
MYNNTSKEKGTNEKGLIEQVHFRVDGSDSNEPVVVCVRISKRCLHGWYTLAAAILWFR